jgi:multiple antibiotic resistance protein
MSVYSIAFSLFLILNSIGAIPAVCEFLKDFSVAKQRKILLKDSLAIFILLLVFSFLGEYFFEWIEIKDSTIRMAGGLLLGMVSLKLIFPSLKKYDIESPLDEPFIVPIATPLVAGPGALSGVMIFAAQTPNLGTMFSAILLAWIPTAILLYFARDLKRVIGDKGIIAFQRLMGLILTLIAVQMFLVGLTEFVQHNFGR